METFVCVCGYVYDPAAGDPDTGVAPGTAFDGLPEDFIEWIKICDGGRLFETSMFTTNPYDDALQLPFTSYDMYYDAEMRKVKKVSDGWFIFAASIINDLFFFDLNKKDGQVYQWDSEENKIYASWLTFEDWLTGQINDAAELIDEDELDRLGIKLLRGNYE